MTNTRRVFLKLLSGGVVAAALPLQTSAKTASKPMLHEDIARHAAKLARKKNTRLLVLYPDGSLANLIPLADQFKALTGVSIDFKQGSLDEISAEIILNENLRSSNVDVALPATFGMPDLVDSGSIHDLTDFAAQYEPAGFESSLYQHGDHFDQRLYGYQTDGDCYLMFYNRQFMEDESLRKAFEDETGTPLEIPRTWQALDRQITFFNKPAENRFGGSLFRNQNYTAWEFWVRLHAKGVLPFDEHMKSQLTGDAGVSALEELSSLSTSLEPGVFSNGLFENFSSFAQGNKYCNIGWGGTQKYLNGPKSAIKGHLHYAPLPGGSTTKKDPWLPFFNWGWNFVVPKSSTQAELAYLFCLFASTPIPSTLAVREADGYFDPFKPEHYEDESIQAIYSEAFLTTHRYSMNNAFPDLYIRGRGLYFDALRQAVFACGTGMESPEAMLQSVSAAWEKITDELGRDLQLKQWEYLRDTVYPEKIRGSLS